MLVKACKKTKFWTKRIVSLNATSRSVRNLTHSAQRNIETQRTLFLENSFKQLSRNKTYVFLRLFCALCVRKQTTPC